jgi:hypothetical protein
MVAAVAVGAAVAAVEDAVEDVAEVGLKMTVV